MTRDDIIAAARSAVGAPFRHQGRMVSGVTDCVGLAAHVCDQLGIAYSDQSGYSRMPSNGLLEAALDGQPFLSLVNGPLSPGDLILLRIRREPQHVAIFAGYNPLCEAETIIHADASIGQVCEHLFTQKWRSRVVRSYRFVGIES
jgi:cell wall-associated NlpC family hydrolase